MAAALAAAWLAAGMLAAGAPARAQTSPAQVPQGSPIPRIAPTTPPPALPNLAPAPLPPAVLPSAYVAVNSVAIDGATAFPAAELLALAGGLVGPHTGLNRIEAARRAILLHYRNASGGGYPFVDVAARVDKGGILRFLITEGYFADIKLSGDVGPVGTLVLKFLHHLTKERPIKNATIEYWLLLARSIPGLQVDPLVQASEREPGAFTLVAQLKRSSVSGNLTLDNRASPQTGTGEALLTVGLNSQTALGERSEVAMFLAGNSGQQLFGQFGEQFFVGNSGVQVRLYGGLGDTLPCCDLRAVNYVGKTDVFGAQVSYPLLLSRVQQLYLRTGLDAIDATAMEDGARASGDSLRVLRAEADYSRSDGLLGPGLTGETAMTVRVSHGLSLLGASANGRTDAGRLNEVVDFTKFDGEISREQTLAVFPGGDRLSVYGLLAGQVSNNILPSAEEFYLGGLRYTRGFYAGEVSGDRALAGTVEVRFSREVSEPMFGRVEKVTPQLYAFYDWGETWQNQSTDANHLLRSYGGGVRAGISNNVRLELELVRRITRQVGGADATPDAADALYLRAVTQF